MIVEAPTRPQPLRAYVFGFLAVAIGIYLAVLIFRAILGGAFHI